MFTYLYSGRYTNNAAATQGGFSFDTVGFLGGGSTWSSTSTTDELGFTNVQVTLGNFSDGTWANDASGNWGTTNNWVNGVAANGAGFIAGFSAVALTADRTVTLDTPRTVGAMIFGATGGSTNNWFVAGGGGSALTLDTGLLTAPAITVNQNTATLNLSVISTNGLTVSGGGILVLGGNNTLVGALNLNGGELGFSSLGNLPLSSAAMATINFGGGALLWEPGNTVDISSQGISINFGGNAGFDTGPNNVTLATGFGDGGVGGLIKLGTGKLTLNGAVSYTGTTTVSNGVLALDSSGSIAASTNITVLSGATLDVSAQSGGGLTLQNQNLAGSGTVQGNISDSAGVTIAPGVAGAGTLTVNGNLSLNGGGVLNYDLGNVITAGSGSNDLIVVSGNLNLSGPTALNVNLINGAPGLGTYTLFTYGSFSGDTANLTAPVGFSVTNNTIAKTIGLVVTHVPENLTWKGDNSANAWDTDITENWLQSGTPAFFFTGDAVTFDDTGSETPPLNITTPVFPAAVTVNTAQTYDFTGATIGSGQLTKSNSGTLILENTNTYSGPTVISGGVLQVGGPVNAGASGTVGTGAVTNNGALVFDLGVDYALANAIYGTGSITNIGNAGTVTLSGNIHGASVTMAGLGVMVLAGSNSYTGPTVVSSGSLHPRNNWALGAGSAGAAVSNGAQLYIDANISITNKPLSLAGTGLTADGALRKGGGGVTDFGGVITLTADTQIQVDGGATLNLTNAAGINAPGINVTLGADANGRGNITGPLALGGGSLTVQDAGTWTIAATNNFTGLTTINGGTLDIAGTSTLGPVSAFTPNYVTVGGGILGVTNNVTFADGLRGFTVSGTAGGFDVAAGATLVIANPITGSGTLIKSDSGTLVLSGANSFSGTLDVDSGANAVNDGILLVTTSSAIANVVGPIAIRDSLGGASTFELNGTNGNITVPQDITLSGRSPAIPAIQSAAGTNTLAGNLTGGAGGSQYRLESDSGLLTIGTASTVLTFTTADPQTFTFQGNGAFLVAGVISDGTAATGIEKDGNGTLTLGAVNANTGPTAVTAGALLVNGATGAGTVTVSGGLLGGTGTINGQVNVGAGGTLSPGASLGTLTLSSNLTLAGNTFIEVNASTGARDQVAGLTSVAYGGTLTVSNVSGSLAPGASFQIFPVTTFTGNFASISGAGVSWSFNPTNGVLTVAGGSLPSTPTNLTFSVSGGNVTLGWPQSYTGWILQAQTNSLTTGLRNNWVDIGSSATTNSLTFPVSASNPTVFYRLRHP